MAFTIWARFAICTHPQGIKHPPRIAYDEWNVWYRTLDGGLEERYDFSDALAVATYLNIFVRNCEFNEGAARANGPLRLVGLEHVSPIVV